MVEENIGKTISLQGLAADTKPVLDNSRTGSTFWELDTKTAYVFSGNNINPATSNGWWPV
jgi:hypothetical protein